MKKLTAIGIIAFERSKEIRNVITNITSHTIFDSHTFYFNKDIFSLPASKGGVHLPAKAFFKKIDALVSVGGDGTFLSAARLVARSQIPLIGINMGRLGFLTDITAANAVVELKEILDGHYRSEKRMMFDVSLVRSGRVVARDICLNDVVIKGAGKLLNLSVLYGPELVSFYTADGLIVATPTGSTAYSMASGGPIVYPSLSSVIITPICSHSLTQKPIVCSIVKPVIVKMHDEKTPMHLSFDGKTRLPLRCGDEVRISRSRHDTTLLAPKKVTYFQVLREKLLWGKAPVAKATARSF